MSEDTIVQTFQVAEPARLKLSNIRGSVEIQPGEPGLIVVTAVKHGNGSSRQTTIEMSQCQDGTVVVETRHDEGVWRIFNFTSPTRVDYTVRVPPTCILRVSVVSSSLSIRGGLTGEFSLNTVSGSIRLQDLVGSLKINSVSGDITGLRLSSDLSIETVSGDVRLNESDLPSLQGNTVSGDLSLHTSLGVGPYKISSVSGDVQFFVPADSTCTAEVSGVSGSLKSSLPFTSQRRSAGSKTAEIQGGGVPIKLNSVSGDLWIGRIGDEPGASTQPISPTPPTPPTQPTPPTPPTPFAPPEPFPTPPERLSTAEILAMVERGELSVDEAIRRMQS
jgi:hypothetical protein